MPEAAVVVVVVVVVVVALTHLHLPFSREGLSPREYLEFTENIDQVPPQNDTVRSKDNIISRLNKDQQQSNVALLGFQLRFCPRRDRTPRLTWGN